MVLKWGIIEQYLKLRLKNNRTLIINTNTSVR